MGHRSKRETYPLYQDQSVERRLTTEFRQACVRVDEPRATVHRFRSNDLDSLPVLRPMGIRDSSRK